MANPLMPKATAVWLIDNTALSFEQIADFCGLHPLEVQAIADGEVSSGIQGIDPLQNGQLARGEIEKAQADSSYRMKILVSTLPQPKPAPRDRNTSRFPSAATSRTQSPGWSSTIRS